MPAAATSDGIKADDKEIGADIAGNWPGWRVDASDLKFSATGRRGFFEKAICP
jgi:hypothetical protein